MFVLIKWRFINACKFSNCLNIINNFIYDMYLNNTTALYRKNFALAL